MDAPLHDLFIYLHAVLFQYADNLTDVFKDYNNLDGETPVEFRIPEPTLSLLNLPTPFEAQYVKFKILVS